MGGYLEIGNETSAELRVVLEGVELALGERRVFRGLDCGFPRGRISVVLGGSGAGKSTLLRLIGGLQQPDRGTVRVAGQEVSRPLRGRHTPCPWGS